MSVATEVCRMVEERLGRESYMLVEVGVEVGDDSGLEPENLQFCLESLLGIPPFRGAKPVLARCGGDVLRLSYMEIDDERQDD